MNDNGRATEFPGYLKIAVPVALSYLGIMALGMTDLVLVGRLGPAAQGAVGVGTSLFSWFLIFGIGLLSSLDYFVSRSFGAGDRNDAAKSLVQALWLGTFLSLPFTGLILVLATRLRDFGVHESVTPLAEKYLSVLALSLPPVFWFSAARSYLQALHRVWEGFALLMVANLVNYALNRVWIESMGCEGSAWATVFSRYGLAVGMLAFAGFHSRGTKWKWNPERVRIHELFKLGLPAGLQGTAEVGVFALSTLLAGRLSPESVAAHQIVLNLASMSFMVPLGLGAAAAVSVGYFLGRGEPAEARRQGWLGLAYTLGFMSLAAVVFSTSGKMLVRFYSDDPQVLGLALPVLMIAALFQLSDGTQTCLTGALRGWGETAAPFWINLAGHWLIGLPLGLWLGFRMNGGVAGIWTGLAAGLTVVAAALLWVWNQRSKIDQNAPR